MNQPRTTLLEIHILGGGFVFFVEFSPRNLGKMDRNFGEHFFQMG